MSDTCDSIIKTTDGGNLWVPKKLPYNGNIWTSVYFSNATTGYICGGDGIILKTTDAGANWFINYSNHNQFFESIYFPDTNTGYAVGDIIIRTTDGGNNWIPQKAYVTGIYAEYILLILIPVMLLVKEVT